MIQAQYPAIASLIIFAVGNCSYSAQAELIHWPLDWEEELLWLQGLRPPLTETDTDGDGISDEDEEVLLLDPFNPEDGHADMDEDDYDEAWEWYISSDPEDAADPQPDFEGTYNVVSQTNWRKLSATPVSASFASSTVLINGDFADHTAMPNGRWWVQGSVGSWTAVSGSQIEVWDKHGNIWVELAGTDEDYGIKQTVTAGKGVFALHWKDRGRLTGQDGVVASTAYSVRVYSEGTGGEVASKTFNTAAGQNKIAV